MSGDQVTFVLAVGVALVTLLAPVVVVSIGLSIIKWVTGTADSTPLDD